MSANPKIEPHLLIVDDDDRIRKLLSAFLKKKGFGVSEAASAQEAGALIALFCFDVIILDQMMPMMTGLEFLDTLGPTFATPVIMLTAKADVEDRIAGLSKGASDYLGKPFEPEELYWRIRSLLTRHPLSEFTTPELSFGMMRFDTKTFALYGPDGRVHLTETEEKLLASLIQANGEAKTRDSLAIEFDAAGRSIDVLITRLRRKIEVNPGAPQFIRTVRGVGYRFVPHG